MEISKGLKKELTILSGLASGLCLLVNKPKLASLFAIGAGALQTMPVKTSTFLGKSVVITGGSRGLGLAIARELIQEGALVTIMARDKQELSFAKLGRNDDELKSLTENQVHSRVLKITADVTDPIQVFEAFKQVESKFGKIDVLINNAGSISVGPLNTMEIEDFEAQINLHLLTIVRNTKIVTPFLKKIGGGNIVNICSVGGKIPVPHMSTYSASKFALAGFSETSNAELASDGILVTTVFPGLMRTGSIIQAVFKGDHEKEYTWFALGDLTPGISVSAKYAAKTILNAVRTGDSQVVISLFAKTSNFMHNNFPEVFSRLNQVIAAGLPKGDSKERKTGAQSSKWLDEKIWYLPYYWFERGIEEKLNQEEKRDAEFNLNLKKITQE